MPDTQGILLRFSPDPDPYFVEHGIEALTESVLLDAAGTIEDHVYALQPSASITIAGVTLDGVEVANGSVSFSVTYP